MNNCLKEDFKRKLLLDLDNKVYESNKYSFTARNSILYYEFLVKNFKFNENILLICNASIESHLISMFSILSPNNVFLIGEDMNPIVINKIIKDNNIDITIKPEDYKNECIKVKIIKNYFSFEEFKEAKNSKYELKTIKNILDSLINKESGTTIFMSSGSTGHPKIIPLKFENINSCYQSVINGFLNKLSFKKIYSPNDTSFVSILPHLYAFSHVSSSSIYALSIKSKTSPLLSISSQIKKNHERSLVILVPSALRMILNLIKNKVLLDKLTVVSAGEPLNSTLAKQVINYKINDFYNLYGSTEVSPWIIFLDVLRYFKEFKNEISPIIPAGKPLPNVKCIISPNKELMASSKNVFEGYLNYDNSNLFHFYKNEKYYKTGDNFKLSNDLYFCEGRINGAIKIGGHFINPILIEAFLKSKFNISEVLVLPDFKNSFIYIILFHEKSDQISLDIKKFIHNKISNKIPMKFFNINDDIKLLRTGKIDRRFYNNKYINSF